MIDAGPPPDTPGAACVHSKGKSCRGDVLNLRSPHAADGVMPIATSIPTLCSMVNVLFVARWHCMNISFELRRIIGFDEFSAVASVGRYFQCMGRERGCAVHVQS